MFSVAAQSGAPRSAACAPLSWSHAEPMAGTASPARTWLLIEQPGPWGKQALTQSRLDPQLGQELETVGAAAGVRAVLIRRTGRHPSPLADRPRRVFVAHTVPGRSWLRTALLRDVAELRSLSMERLGAGWHDNFGAPHRGSPLALVCTHGKRDKCCAVLGRPLVTELAASGDADVWEVTHIGGHRFSPTLLVLPFGYAYGRMSAPEVKEVITEARDGRMVLAGCRGRSAWGRPEQAADLAVRELARETREDAVSVLRCATEPEGWQVTVGHTDGRRWLVRVLRGSSSPPAPGSCGAAVLPQTRMDVAAVTALPERAPGPLA